MMRPRTLSPILGIALATLVSAPAYSQWPNDQSPPLSLADGEAFRAELIEMIEVLDHAAGYFAGMPVGDQLPAARKLVEGAAPEDLALVRKEIATDPGWHGAIDALRAVDATPEVQSSACYGDLTFPSQCGVLDNTGVRLGLLTAAIIADQVAIAAQAVCDAVTPVGSSIACPIAGALKIIAITARGLYDLAQFCGGERGGEQANAIHCHLDDQARYTSDSELLAQTEALIAQLDENEVLLREVLRNVGGLARVSCDIERLITTEEEDRFSAIDVCEGEPGFPYMWPDDDGSFRGPSADRGARSSKPAVDTLILETHLSQGNILPSLYLPEDRGGMIEQVRDLVWNTIAAQQSLSYAMTGTLDARELAQLADALLAAREFASALRSYSRAYQALTPTTTDDAAEREARLDGTVQTSSSRMGANSAIETSRVVSSPLLTIPGPNPVTGSLNYNITLERPSLVTLRVYSVDGRVVETLHHERMVTGLHTFTWDLATGRQRLASGVYFLRVDAGDVHETRKFVLSR